MDKSKKNVKVIAFGRRIRQIRNLERKLECFESEMDRLAKEIDDILAENNWPSDPFKDFYLTCERNKMDALYDEINNIRDAIDKIEKNVIEIRIRF